MQNEKKRKKKVNFTSLYCVQSIVRVCGDFIFSFPALSVFFVLVVVESGKSLLFRLFQDIVLPLVFFVGVPSSPPLFRQSIALVDCLPFVTFPSWRKVKKMFPPSTRIVGEVYNGIRELFENKCYLTCYRKSVIIHYYSFIVIRNSSNSFRIKITHLSQPHTLLSIIPS